MKNSPILFLPICCLLLSFSLDAKAEIGLTFISRAEIKLCPEYPYGGVVAEIGYTIGSDPTPHAADIVSQSLNTETNTLTVDLRFPTTMGTLPFKISSTCRNAVGFSNRSNVVAVSNCNALAKLDADFDGITNNLEDTNCDNFFSPGDLSNPDNVDTDGDGVRDLVERVSFTDATNPGSSPRPYVVSSSPFDPDSNGNSNPVVWRTASGTWFIKDFTQADLNLAIQFGASGDIPYVYQPDGAPSNVGVIRKVGNDYQWLFNGPGFKKSDGSFVTSLTFGIFGDNVIPGPWEKPGVTNPAVARLFNNQWTFAIYLSNGTIRNVFWGGNGDVTKVQDYDGDGLFDVAVFRPGQQKTFIIRSSDSLGEIHQFGTGTADYFARGDYTGDGVDDITFWEPASGLFTTMTSDNGFDDSSAASKDPGHYFEMQLGLYNVHLPLNWHRRNGKSFYTVVDHAAGLRYWRTSNTADGTIKSLQWGLAGDHQG